MIAVLCVILALLGLFGTWPVLNNGIWVFFTQNDHLMNGNQILLPQYALYRFFPWKYWDGIILIIFAVILFASLFVVTRPWLLKARRIFIAFLFAFFFFELVVVLSSDVPLDAYLGLLYTVTTLGIAVGLSFTDIGSKNALVSTGMGMPTTELSALRKTITDIWDAVQRKVKWHVQSTDISQLEGVTIEEESLKIGRDPQWANLVIPDDYGYVSRKHAILTPQGQGCILQFRDARYAMRINKKLYKPGETYSIDSKTLDIEVVGGWGPWLKINYEITRKKPATVGNYLKNTGDVLKMRYRTARTQIKIISVLLVVIVFGFGTVVTQTRANVFAKVKQERQTLLAKIKRQKSEFQKLKRTYKDLKGQLEQIKVERKRLVTQLKEANKNIKVLKDSLTGIQKTYINPHDPGEVSQVFADLQRVANEIGEILLNTTVFLAEVKHRSYTISGTIWLGQKDEQLYLFTAAHVVWPERFDENIHPTDIVENVLVIKNYFTKENFRKIPRGMFNVDLERDWAYVKLGSIQELPEEIHPFILKISPEIIKEVVKTRRVVSWVGYPNGTPATGAVGVVTEIKDGFLHTTISNYHGASGGPLFIVPVEEDVNFINAVGLISGFDISNMSMQGRIAVLPQIESVLNKEKTISAKIGS